MLRNVICCKFSTRTHKGRACFTVPKHVQNELGLRNGNWIRVIIDSSTGHFEGTKRMMSGPEIYGKDLNKCGIKKNQPIIAIASRPGKNIGGEKDIQNPYLFPSEDESALIEGGRTLVQVNRYERDPRARERCIQIFGVHCTVCGFDFAETYGKIGAGFIHVHHLTPLSIEKKKHRIDVHRDLRPVCPNCHEMLHRKKPPLSIRELKARISK
ncbi:MAG: HNH endonuclease [Terracidiphilus sp.]